MLQEIEEKGYTVVKNVLSPQAAFGYYHRFWNWLEYLKPGLTREDPETWKQKPFNLHGILQYYKIGHAQFIWDLRCEEAVMDVFAKLWDVEKEDLICSFDGACMMFPSKMKSRPWPHVDQGKNKENLETIQGFVNLLPCRENDGGLVVYEKSHLLHKSVLENREEKGNWIKFTDDDMETHYKNCKRVKVTCDMGDMVLWDSRAVHYAVDGKTAAEWANKDFENTFRSVIYVCMVPREKCTQKNQEKRKKLFSELRTTSHWPHEPKAFPKTPRSYGREDPYENTNLQKILPDVKCPFLI